MADGRASEVTTGQRLFRFLSLEWVPVTTALVSLVFSVSSLFISTREPAVIMLLPDQIRVAQGEDFGFAYMYVQPAFVNTGRNERVEVIRDMKVRVRPRGDSPPSSRGATRPSSSSIGRRTS